VLVPHTKHFDTDCIAPLDWDLEIRKRYAQPLFSETNEFPDAETIQSRMVPICYEMGIGGGAAPGSAEFMNLATETFLKEILADQFGRVRSNGDHYIKTAAYKKRLEKEEAMWLREEGGMVKNAAGLLPVEVEATEGRQPLDMSDLKLALSLGDTYVQQVPFVASKVRDEWNSGARDADEEQEFDARGAVKANGVQPPPTMNGHAIGDEMEVDGVADGWGWSGGSASDRDALGSLLDDCLAVGS
jgi:transcriptional coactivator HFI1/ADA1